MAGSATCPWTTPGPRQRCPHDQGPRKCHSRTVMVSAPRTNQHIVSGQLIEMVQLRGYSALAEQLRLCPACQLRCPGIPRCPMKVSDRTHAVGNYTQLRT